MILICHRDERGNTTQDLIFATQLNALVPTVHASSYFCSDPGNSLLVATKRLVLSVRLSVASQGMPGGLLIFELWPRLPHTWANLHHLKRAPVAQRRVEELTEFDCLGLALPPQSYLADSLSPCLPTRRPPSPPP